MTSLLPSLSDQLLQVAVYLLTVDNTIYHLAGQSISGQTLFGTLALHTYYQTIFRYTITNKDMNV